MSRLKPIDEIQVDKAHLNSTLMQFDKNTKLLEEWYKKFNNYYVRIINENNQFQIDYRWKR